MIKIPEWKNRKLVLGGKEIETTPITINQPNMNNLKVVGEDAQIDRTRGLVKSVSRNMRRAIDQIKANVDKTRSRCAIRYAKDVLRNNPTFHEELVQTVPIEGTENSHYTLTYDGHVLGDMRYEHDDKKAGFKFYQKR